MLDRLRRLARRAIRPLCPDTVYGAEYIEYARLPRHERTPEDLTRTLETGCQVLEDLGVKYWISRGSLLGFHRDGGYLPGDFDLDVDVQGDHRVYDIIKAMPFEPLFVTSNGGHYMQFAFLDREAEVIFDIWFFYDRGARLFNRNIFGRFWLPAERIERLASFSFRGRDYPVPDPEWYCRYWYGDSWRTPKRYGSDWSQDYRRDCRGFEYLGLRDAVLTNYFEPGAPPVRPR